MTAPMRMLLVTDAWTPQVNGVVRTLTTTASRLERMGHSVTVLAPGRGRTLPCPGYPEIRLTLQPAAAVRETLSGRRFDTIHIATEGPLGWAARRWCRRHGLRFTTSYHTRFPEYVRLRAPVPLPLSYALLRRFHGAAARTLVRTPTQRRLLAERGFENLAVWPGGVDTALFRPVSAGLLDLPRPIAVCVGRVAPEKNLDAFLKLDLPGSKIVVGDGPALERYRARYGRVHFPGYRHGDELVRILASADVFVFPSRTDTLGLVMLEAMACGVPVAAFPVPGPLDIVRDGANGALDEDLREAVFRALAVPGDDCVEFARAFSWQRATERFASLLVPAPGMADRTTKPPLPGGAGRRAYNSDACTSRPPVQKPTSINPVN